MTNIEQNLKDICRQKGLSLTDVANRVGTSPSNLLSSIKGNPTLSKLQGIAKALQIPVAELLSNHPEPALGFAVIEGKTYQLSAPSASMVQLPIYDNHSKLRSDLRQFAKNCIKGSDCTSMMAMLETMEAFTLVYDPAAAKFYLSICYMDGKMATSIYDKYEYAITPKGASEDVLEWEIDDLLEDLSADIEESVPRMMGN